MGLLEMRTGGWDVGYGMQHSMQRATAVREKEIIFASRVSD